MNAFTQLHAASRHYNTSIWFQVMRSKRLHDRSLFSLEDILFWGLTDPKITSSDIDCFMSREARTRLQSRINDSSAGPDVDDKARFYRLCSSLNLPIPETYGILKTASSTSTQSSGAEMPLIHISDLPNGEFVAKPIWGMKGKGLLFFEKSEGEYLVGGKAMDEATILKMAADYAAKDKLVVQKRLQPHPDLEAVSKSKSVQSVRIVTYIDEKLRPHILFARFKFIRKGNDVDNFSDGETGNLIADVNLDTGHITKAMKKEIGELGLKSVFSHPDSGKPLDITLPDWGAAIDLALASAMHFQQLRTLAWDIALTPEGPVILEANQDWEIFPIGPYQKPNPIENWESLIR